MNIKKKPFKGLIHCFTATEELANEVLKLGFFISISGIITFKNAKVLRDIVKKIPLERLLVETDAPYLSPEPMRGKRNEPAHVIHTANYLADMLNIILMNCIKKPQIISLIYSLKQSLLNENYYFRITIIRRRSLNW